jgi:hypothetical protein
LLQPGHQTADIEHKALFLTVLQYDMIHLNLFLFLVAVENNNLNKERFFFLDYLLRLWNRRGSMVNEVIADPGQHRPWWELPLYPLACQ